MDNKPGIQFDATLTEEQKRIAELVGFETYQSAPGKTSFWTPMGTEIPNKDGQSKWHLRGV